VRPTVNTGSACVLSVKADRGMAANSWRTDVTFVDRVPAITVAGDVPVSIGGQPSIVRAGNADHFSSIDHLIS
jgi:taurine dioxygenase